MATPATLKKLEEKKHLAQQRREKNATDQLLPLGVMTNAPSAHLLIREKPNPAPRMMDLRLRPLSTQFTKYREPKINFAVDSHPTGHDYTSFESAINVRSSAQQQYRNMNNGMNFYGNFNYNYEGKKTRTKLKFQTVQSMPAQMPTIEHKLNVNNLVCFHGKDHFLSSLYPTNITIDGHIYLSVEHYYQACKIFRLIGCEEAQQLREISDPLKVKIKAKDILHNYGVDNGTVENWKNKEGLNVLLHAIRHKFTEYGLREKILATNDALLCQTYDRDSMYAVGMTEQKFCEWAKENEGKVLKFPTELNPEMIKYLPIIGRGKNVLGVICMKVRKLIQDDQQNAMIPKDDTKSISSNENSTSASTKNVDELTVSLEMAFKTACFKDGKENNQDEKKIVEYN